MKISIIFLGLSALIFSTKSNAETFKIQQLNEQYIANVYSVKAVNELKSDSFYHENSNKNNSDDEIFDPNSVIEKTYDKPIEDIIKEDKLITENRKETYQPLQVIDKKIINSIKEDNQIIESTISNEVLLLDFTIINQYSDSEMSKKQSTIIKNEMKL